MLDSANASGFRTERNRFVTVIYYNARDARVSDGNQFLPRRRYNDQRIIQIRVCIGIQYTLYYLCVETTSATYKFIIRLRRRGFWRRMFSVHPQN